MEGVTLTTFHTKILVGKIEFVKECLAIHPEYLEAQDTSNGRTALHCAAASGKAPMLELILQKVSGPALDILDARGLTPLHQALFNVNNWARSYNKSGDSVTKILKAVGAAVLKVDTLPPTRLDKLRKPIPEEIVVETRWRIYFSRSLVVRLLLE